MRSVSARVLVGIFAAVFAAYIVYASASVLVEAHAGGAPHGHGHAALLAAFEIPAALAFTVRRLRIAAATALIAVFVIAGVITAANGAVPASLVFYACTAAFVPLVERGLDRRQTA